jgi:hypothetical protein
VLGNRHLQLSRHERPVPRGVEHVVKACTQLLSGGAPEMNSRLILLPSGGSSGCRSRSGSRLSPAKTTQRREREARIEVLACEDAK